jgi:tRNA(fMet)-specific endonuclease VapC
MIVADTDVLIDFLRGKGAASRIRLELQHGLSTTAVSAFELLAGAHGNRQKNAVETLLEAMEVLPLSRAEAQAAAEVRRSLEVDGEGIGMGDSLIAGIVLHRNRTLLTRNRKHFERVKGLRLDTLTPEP